MQKIYVREIGWINRIKSGAWAMGGPLPESYVVPIDKVEGGFLCNGVFYKDEHVIAWEEIRESKD